MLGQCPRRWTNIDPTLDQCLVSSESDYPSPQLTQRPNIKPTLVQCIVFAGPPAKPYLCDIKVCCFIPFKTKIIGAILNLHD